MSRKWDLPKGKAKEGNCLAPMGLKTKKVNVSKIVIELSARRVKHGRSNLLDPTASLELHPAD